MVCEPLFNKQKNKKPIETLKRQKSVFSGFFDYSALFPIFVQTSGMVVAILSVYIHLNRNKTLKEREK